MYTGFFGLRSLPFEDRADTEFLYPTREFEETLAALEYEARFGQGLALVTGEAGTGKTLLLRALLARFDKSDHAVALTWPTGGGGDLIRECSKGFGVTLPSSQNHNRHMDRLRRHLQRIAEAGHHAILMIDQGENLTTHHIGQLSALAELEGEKGRLLRIILAAQPQVSGQLDRPEFSRIRQQLFGDRCLHALSETPSAEYIRHRLQAAGAADAAVFDDEATRCVHEVAGGVPRLINRVCNAAMLTAYGAGERNITRAIVEEAIGRSAGTVKSMVADDLLLPRGGSGAAPWHDRGTTESNAEPTIDAPPGEAEDSVETSNDRPAFAVGTLARLERAIAKAERMSATTQASLTQLTAVEQHLCSLLERAESVSTGIAPLLRQGVEAVENAQRRLSQLVQESQGRAAEVESRVGRVNDVAAQLEELVTRSDAAAESATVVEARLQRTSSALTAKGEELQAHADRLSKGVHQSQDAQTGLAGLLREVQTSSREAESGAARIRETTEGQIASARKLISENVGAWRKEIDELVEKVGRTLEGSSRVAEAKLNEFSERIVRMGGENQQRATTTAARTLAVLKETSEAARQEIAEAQRNAKTSIEREASERERSCVQTLDEATARATRTCAEIQAAQEASHRSTEETVAHTRSILERLSAERTREVETTIGELRRSLAQVREEHETLAAKFAQRARTAGDEEIAKLRKTTQELGGTSQQQVDGLLRQVATAVAVQEERGATLLTKIENAAASAERLETHLTETTVARCRDEWQRIVESAQTQVAELTTQIEGLSETESALRPSVDRLSHSLQSDQRRVAELRSTIEQQEGDLEVLVARAGTMCQPLAQAVERGETLLAEVTASEGRIHGLRRDVGGELLEIGGACERVAAARTQAREAEQICAALHTDEEVAEKLLGELGEGTKTARETVHDLRAITDETRRQTRELAACRDAAQETTEDARSIVVSGDALVARLGEAARLAKTTAEDTTQRVEELATSRARADQTATHLDMLIGDGRRLNEALEGLSGYADEKITQLSSQHAAASAMAERLCSTSVAAQGFETRLQARQQAIESAGKSVQELMTAVESLAQDLPARQEQLAALLRDATQSHQNGGALASELAARTEEARGTTTSIAEHQSQAAKLVERLAAITHALAAAKEIAATLHATTQHGSQIADRLSELSERAEPQCRTLHEIAGAYPGVVETYEQLRHEVEALSERVTGHASTTVGRLEETDQALAETGEGVTALTQRLDELATRTTAMAQQIAGAMTQPAAVIHNVQTQTAQLERVSAAVRKVFAALSQATLDARQQSGELRATGDQAAKRVQLLVSETSRAASGLREWVGEAAQVQSRLERVLAAAPPVQQTHPGEALRTVGRTLERLSGRSDFEHDLSGSVHPTEPESEDREFVTRAADRAAEIARLIADAKETEVSVAS